MSNEELTREELFEAPLVVIEAQVLCMTSRAKLTSRTSDSASVSGREKSRAQDRGLAWLVDPANVKNDVALREHSCISAADDLRLAKALQLLQQVATQSFVACNTAAPSSDAALLAYRALTLLERTSRRTVEAPGVRADLLLAQLCCLGGGRHHGAQALRRPHEHARSRPTDRDHAIGPFNCAIYGTNRRVEGGGDERSEPSTAPRGHMQASLLHRSTSTEDFMPPCLVEIELLRRQVQVRRNGKHASGMQCAMAWHERPLPLGVLSKVGVTFGGRLRRRRGMAILAAGVPVKIDLCVNFGLALLSQRKFRLLCISPDMSMPLSSASGIHDNAQLSGLGTCVQQTSQM